ncbi:unnamed protein product [Anisakis simplex]|uniref:Isochorismatase domain-containing protein n=1 Tax=Anisakis simplex TaxID=6269 RepID=A0A0M3KJ76_ANISI|nr:unnamed protein product [Anisakis simplex]
MRIICGQLLFKTGEVFVLESNYADNEQQRNDVAHLLDAIRHEVPSILMEKFSMKLIEFPLPAEKDSECDKLKSEFVLATDDLSTNTTGLVVLIEGFGTAGQWDPMLVLSEGLEQGSQISSVSKCIQNGWSVFILHASCLCSTDVNTNDGSANGEKLLENVRNGHHNADIFSGYSRACLHSCVSFTL